jgi:hypothetical protein
MLGIDDVVLVRNAQCRGFAVMNNSASDIRTNNVLGCGNVFGLACTIGIVSGTEKAEGRWASYVSFPD